MIDYYDELGIDRALPLDSIQLELSKQESIWKSRRTKAPEKAVKMLALIVDAREVFKTQETRSEYERKLAASKQPNQGSSPDVERAEQFVRWEQEAREYYASKQYDLAKTALEKALSYSGEHSEVAPFYLLAAQIYAYVDRYDTALEYINKAIVQEPQDAGYENQKSLIYSQYSTSSHVPANNRTEYQKRSRDAASAAIEKACRNGDTYNEGIGCGLLAFTCYFGLLQRDKETERLARRAVELNDAWGNGQRVVDAIDEENARHEEEEKRRQEAEAERKKREAEAEAERKKREAEEEKRKARIKRIAFYDKLGWLVLFGSWALALYPFYAPMLNGGSPETPIDVNSIDTSLYILLVGFGMAFFNIARYARFGKSAGSVGPVLSLLATLFFSSMFAAIEFESGRAIYTGGAWFQYVGTLFAVYTILFIVCYFVGCAIKEGVSKK